ncbi:unnamed protein product [Durusdinium trenchii]|uniref:Uncharacterized protein n=1 Tax=Durusdinium trenchii TaxID=1381693 RepID=A0ABP0S330_9DINO
MVAGDGPTLGWPGWSKSRGRPEGGAAIGPGAVSWMDVSGRFVPPSTTSVRRAQRPSITPSLQNWPAVSWNTSRGRTASTVSQLSLSSDITEKTLAAGQEARAARQAEGAGPKTAVDAPDVPPDLPAEETPPWTHTAADGPMEVWPEEAPEEEAVAKENHEQWLKLRMEGALDSFGSEADRLTLFEILQMLAVKDAHKEEVLDHIGLGGPINAQDTVYLRGHTGLWMLVKNGSQLVCTQEERSKATAFVAEFKRPVLNDSCRVCFRVAEPSDRTWWLATLQQDVGLMAKGDGSDPATRFVVDTGTNGPVLSGMFVSPPACRVEMGKDGNATSATATCEVCWGTDFHVMVLEDRLEEVVERLRQGQDPNIDFAYKQDSHRCESWS